MRNIKKLFIISVFAALAIVMLVAYGCFIAISPGVGVKITDSPPDLSVVKHFYVGIKDVKLQKGNGAWIKLLDTPASTDLVSLIGESPRLLVDSTPIDEGDYKALRIEFTPVATVVYIYTTTPPSTAQATLSLSATTLSIDEDHKFINHYTEFILDFDMGESLSVEGTAYMFIPKIKLYYGGEVGTISGEVIRSSSSGLDESTSTYLVLKKGDTVITTSYANKQVSSPPSTPTFSFRMTVPFDTYTLEFYRFDNGTIFLFETSVALSETNPDAYLGKIDLTEY